MEKHKCDTCTFRISYKKNPRSLLGRIWKWHTFWCPGWKKYVASLSETEKMLLLEELQRKS